MKLKITLQKLGSSDINTFEWEGAADEIGKLDLSKFQPSQFWGPTTPTWIPYIQPMNPEPPHYWDWYTSTGKDPARPDYRVATICTTDPAKK